MPLATKPVILMILRSELAEASEGFSNSQGSASWSRLEDVMYGLQFASQQSEQKLSDLTSSMPFNQVVEQMARLARAKLTT